jgi:hypothetical protein
MLFDPAMAMLIRTTRDEQRITPPIRTWAKVLTVMTLIMARPPVLLNTDGWFTLPTAFHNATLRRG